MRKNAWLAPLSVTLGVAMIAGCGQSPSATTPGSNFNAPLAAQEGMSPAPTSPEPSMAPSAAPSAMPSGMPPGGPGGPGGPGVPPGIGGGVGPGIGGGIVVGGGTGSWVFGANDLIAFQSDRATGGGDEVEAVVIVDEHDRDHSKGDKGDKGGKDGRDNLGDKRDKLFKEHNFDIFIYDARAATVLAIPGVNTPFNETNPRLSSNAEWLVYQSDANCTQDILLFNLRNQLINTLRTLNTPIFDEREPDVSDDGNFIAYISNETGLDDLRVFDLRTGNNFIVPVANRGLNFISWPTISGNGDVIAYGASAGPLLFDKDGKCIHLADEQINSDIFVYSLRDAAQLTPPFINTPADEYNPDLSLTGDRILFVSNRRVSQDIYEVDLRSGFTDNLVLANSARVDDEPRYLGPTGDAFVFQSNRTGNYRIYAYNRLSGLLDTLPIANEPCTNTLLRSVFPQPGRGVPGGGVVVGGNGVKDRIDRDLGVKDGHDGKDGRDNVH